MNRSDQRCLVKNLCDSIKDEIVKKIDEGVVPAEWDGHELRLLLRGKFEREVSDLMRDKRSKRYRDFINTLITTNV